MKQKTHTWQRVWGRKMLPFLASACMEMLTRRPGLNSSKNKLFVPEGNLHAIYFEQRELDRSIEYYTRFLLKQDLRKYAVWYERQFEAFLDWTTRATRVDFSKASNASLAATAERLAKKLVDFCDLQLYTFLVLEGPGRTLEQVFARRPSALRAISTPYRQTQITKARIALLKLVLSGKPSARSVHRYAERYAWLPMYDFADAPLTEADIQNQVRQIENPAKELRSIGRHHQSGLNAYRKLYGTLRGGELRKLVAIVHYFSYLKEMRDDYRRPAYYRWIPFWETVAKRLGMSVGEVNHLTPQEVVRALTTIKNYRSTVRSRKNSFALWYREGRLNVYSGREVAKVSAPIAPGKAQDELKGFPACRGVVRGTVQIIYHRGEFSRFKDGNVLVTTMTHPEFLGVMKKASAIVTDEGGITCHAAIVSRELRKPCIIGTKNATSILKDGDLVEVNATAGTVKKLR